MVWEIGTSLTAQCGVVGFIEFPIYRIVAAAAVGLEYFSLVVFVLWFVVVALSVFSPDIRHVSDANYETFI